jgi:hypothetical protein
MILLQTFGSRALAPHGAGTTAQMLRARRDRGAGARLRAQGWETRKQSIHSNRSFFSHNLPLARHEGRGDHRGRRAT